MGTTPCCILHHQHPFRLVQGAPWSWKVMEFRKTIFRVWEVIENDDNVMEFFTTALSNSVKVTRLHL